MACWPKSTADFDPAIVRLAPIPEWISFQRKRKITPVYLRGCVKPLQNIEAREPAAPVAPKGVDQDLLRIVVPRKGADRAGNSHEGRAVLVSNVAADQGLHASKNLVKISRMSRIRLLHWKAAEAAPYIEALQKAGYKVEYEEQFRPGLMKSWRESPPDAFVIDLSRLPSHGREIAIASAPIAANAKCPALCSARERKKRSLEFEASCPTLPIAPCRNLPSALRRALANRLADPVKPIQMMDRYRGRTAAQKLGIKEGSAVALIDPPRDFTKVLGELPHRVELLDGDSGENASVTLCFVHGAHALLPTLSAIRSRASASKLWILWRKGGSAARGDLTETLVRSHAIDLGLVDYKICSVNEIWSAMLFAAKR